MNPSRKFYIIASLIAASGLIWIAWHFFFFSNPVSGIHFCIFRNMWSIPCPSCGSTRSILSLLEGNVISALSYNPMGMIAGLTLPLLSAWLIIDFISGKCSLFHSWKMAERLLRKKSVAMTFIILVLSNWIWVIINQS